MAGACQHSASVTRRNRLRNLNISSEDYSYSSHIKKPEKKKTSKEVQKEIEAYLAAGNKIEILPLSASGIKPKEKKNAS